MPYIELLGQSRGYSITTDTINQTFVYEICNEALEDGDETFNGAWGAFFTPNDDIQLALFVYATFPAYRSFPINGSQSIALFLTEHSAEQQTSTKWRVTLTYSVPPPPENQGGQYIQFGLDVGGETIHIMQSRQVRNAVTRTGVALLPPDVRNCIGLTKDSIEGADIVGKGINFNITGYFTPIAWSTGLLAILYALQGNYNNAPFYGFAAGEVMFVSASAQGRQYGLIAVTYNFSAKPNANGLTDLPFPPLFALGHDIIDYLYVRDVDQNFPVQAPTYRYVHRIADPVNFALLGV